MRHKEQEIQEQIIGFMILQVQKVSHNQESLIWAYGRWSKDYAEDAKEKTNDVAGSMANKAKEGSNKAKEYAHEVSSSNLKGLGSLDSLEDSLPMKLHLLVRLIMVSLLDKVILE